MKFGLTQETYEKIKKIIDNSKYKIILFGSRARGDYKQNSDIDLAVLDEVPREEQYEIMNEIDLLDIIYKVDIVFVDKDTKQSLIQSIERDGAEF